MKFEAAKEVAKTCCDESVEAEGEVLETCQPRVDGSGVVADSRVGTLHRFVVSMILGGLKREACSKTMRPLCKTQV